MSELSKALGTAGEPHRIVHEGKTYPFHLLCQKRKDAIEKRLYQIARQMVYEEKDLLKEDEYQAELVRVREAYQNREFSFFAPRAAKMLVQPEGALALLEVVTGESRESVVALMTARKDEVAQLLKTVMDESFPDVKGKPNG